MQVCWYHVRTTGSSRTHICESRHARVSRSKVDWTASSIPPSPAISRLTTLNDVCAISTSERLGDHRIMSLRVNVLCVLQAETLVQWYHSCYFSCYRRRLCRSAWVGFSSPSVCLPAFLFVWPQHNSTRRMAIANGTCVSFCKISLRHILASPGYAPGTITVNVTWMERGFNAGQTHSSMYPSIFNRLRFIARY